MNGDFADSASTDWAHEKDGLRTLRFSPAVEKYFLQEYAQAVLPARQSLLVLGLLLVMLAPALDLFLQPPPVLLPTLRTIQFGFMLPTIALALMVTLMDNGRAWSESASILASLAMGFGFIAERVLGAEHRFHVPHDIPALIFVASLLLGRMRLVRYLPWGLLMISCAIFADFMVWGATNQNMFDQVSSVLFVLVGIIGGYFLERGSRAQWLQSQMLSTQATRDALTGVPNRRHFNDALELLLRDSARQQHSIDLLILDIDDFKAYNDTYGHPAGDACLQRVSQWLSGNIRRPFDFCARIGGEEFAVVWYDCKPEDAVRLAENVRAGVAALNIVHARSRTGPVVTASGGMVRLNAMVPGNNTATMAKQIVQRADDALYAAKREGRNRLMVASAL